MNGKKNSPTIVSSEEEEEKKSTIEMVGKSSGKVASRKRVRRQLSDDGVTPLG